MAARAPEHSPNHAFILDVVARTKGEAARLLDFGCGSGHFVKLARAAGHEAWGVDRFSGFWTYWKDHLDETVAPYLADVQPGAPLPYGDDSFDAVTANQVFEHVGVEHIQRAVNEIARVLKPGGIFIALFPTRDVWFEGHLGVYFPHRLNRWPSLQRRYLHACHALGFGYYRENTAATWAVARQMLLHNGTIVYHRYEDVEARWRAAFGRPPQGLEAAAMRFRLAAMRLAPPARMPGLTPLLRFVHLKRAGRVLLVEKHADPAKRLDVHSSDCDSLSTRLLRCEGPHEHHPDR